MLAANDETEAEESGEHQESTIRLRHSAYGRLTAAIAEVVPGYLVDSATARRRRRRNAIDETEIVRTEPDSAAFDAIVDSRETDIEIPAASESQVAGIPASVAASETAECHAISELISEKVDSVGADHEVGCVIIRQVVSIGGEPVKGQDITVTEMELLVDE